MRSKQKPSQVDRSKSAYHSEKVHREWLEDRIKQRYRGKLPDSFNYWLCRTDNRLMQALHARAKKAPQKRGPKARDRSAMFSQIAARLDGERGQFGRWARENTGAIVAMGGISRMRKGLRVTLSQKETEQYLEGVARRAAVVQAK